LSLRLHDEAFGCGVGSADDIPPKAGMPGVGAEVFGELASGAARVRLKLDERCRKGPMDSSFGNLTYTPTNDVQHREEPCANDGPCF